jgi:2-keto-4-pentenoate hydratase
MTMDEFTIKQVAEMLGRARVANGPTPVLSGDLTPDGAAEGYAVQAALGGWFESHGQGDIAGYKVGATTRVMQDILEVTEPAFGRVMTANVLESGSAVTRGADVITGLECEIAFRLSKDISVSGAQVTRSDVMDCVEAVIPTIEIVQNRYGDYLSRGLGTLVADDFFHKACVLGTPVAYQPDMKLEEIVGRIIVNGDTLHTGSGAEVLGHPLEALVWLANALAVQGGMLEAGQIVSSGSITPVHWVETYPCHARVELDGIGMCEVMLG